MSDRTPYFEDPYGMNGVVPSYYNSGCVPVQTVTLIASDARIAINVSDYNPAIHSNPGPQRTPMPYYPDWDKTPQGGG